MSAMNHEDPYLRTILGFLGITQVEFIHAENLRGGDAVRQSSLTGALQRIREAVEAD